MSFPSTPVNGQNAVINGITYVYSSSENAWTRLTAPLANIVVTGNTTTNSLLVTNSANFNGAANVFGNLVAAATTTSTSTTTGALVVKGGAGIAGALNIANTGDVSANIGTIRNNVNTINANLGSFQSYANTKIGTNSNSSILASTIYTSAGIFWSGNGAAYSSGSSPGGGITYTASATPPVGPSEGDQWYDTTNDILYIWYVNGADSYWVDIGSAPLAANSSLSVGGDGTITGNLTLGQVSNAQAISTTTGALRVVGGASIATGNLYIGGSGGLAITHTGNIIPSANLSFNLGSPTAWYGTFYGISTQAKYADLAENYQADANYEPGTVVVFGGQAEVTITTISHDTRVAGVVSTNPAYLMNAMTEGLPIAFTGRVPCKVKGPIDKGTLLVTSEIPGIAEALVNDKFAPGCVIGKSLSVIEDNSVQTVEIAVGRY